MHLKRIVPAVIIILLTTLAGCEKSDVDITNPTSDRDKFIGTWKSVSTGNGGIRNYNMVITASNSAPDQILMEKFDGASPGTFVPATVSGSTVSIIPTSISGERIEGSGALSDSLRFNFTIDDGQTIEPRTSAGKKL